MNSSKPIGGYFPLELSAGKFPYGHAILLSCARACFEYVLTARSVKRLHYPGYMCEVMNEPLARLGIEVRQYELDESLEIDGTLHLESGDHLLYANYFGVKDTYSKSLVEKYGDKLILDYSQSFYSPAPVGADTIYSPRKFFGVPDGGCLVTDLPSDEKLPVDVSYIRAAHLLKSLDTGIEGAYDDFKVDEESIDRQPVKRMSNLTKRLLDSIDYETIKQKRLENFERLHQALGATNTLSIDPGFTVPMVYPLLVEDASLREKLIDQKIFVPTFWPGLIEDNAPESGASVLASHLIPLPVDQRFGADDMDRIIEAIR